MVSAYVYIEGGSSGSSSKESDIRCREGFQHRMPRLIACGSRNSAFDSFKTGLISHPAAFVALWVDSEEPLSDLEKAWNHLLQRDSWTRPQNATDDQVLFMTTCMETWLVADKAALKGHFREALQESALPSLENLEARPRQDVQQKLQHATRNCPNAYQKGAPSFEVLGKLDPSVLSAHLPSFVRVRRLLDSYL